MTDTEDKAKANQTELLSFRVGTQEYAVDIMTVREIRGWTNATPLPHAPLFVRGVINLRGTVLTIVDLSDRLGMGPIEFSERNVIIVVEAGSQLVGLLVDAVSDILTVSAEDLQPPPEMLTEGPKTFVSALTIVHERMVRILDLDAALPAAEIEAA